MAERLRNTELAGELFDGWQETLIWSCLQGVMGGLYVTRPENPPSVMAALADFIFFAGMPDRELVLYRPEECGRDFVIMVPQDDRWGRLIEQCYAGKAKKTERYAIRKEPGVFDREKLKAAADSLPRGYEMRLIDEELYYKCRAVDWCRDWVAQYETYEAYREHGLGVAVLKDGEFVSGVSSYSHYNGGVELEIDTGEKYRRRGFGYICAARMILECLDRGLYPSWDAQNMWSVGLAEKLGYHFSHAYTAYEIHGYLNT